MSTFIMPGVLHKGKIRTQCEVLVSKSENTGVPTWPLHRRRSCMTLLSAAQRRVNEYLALAPA